MLELFESLSPQSVYFRFFSPLKRLPHSMLARFTQIDYDREIALVALQASAAAEKMLGVARIIVQPKQSQAEFAVLVADLVLSENTEMLTLGRKLDFQIRRMPETNQYELTIDLGQSA